MHKTIENQEIIRILVVDDQPLIRFGVVSLLNAEPDFKVVGELQSCSELSHQGIEPAPDIVLLDLELKDSCASNALHDMQEMFPAAKIIIFSSQDDEALVVAAVRAGVQGYIIKGSSNVLLTEAIRKVRNGSSYFDTRLMRTVMHRLQRGESAAEKLTKRELLVLTEVGMGKPNKRIAEQLGITVRTVKFHISSILSKLGAHNRTQAVRIAANNGLIKLS